ncbi:succinate dehydrogenase cytochrome b subunit [Catellatospora bangladeshensis]|uniref:Succinate dehydrogenase n=1 Tax=Catellatospora bangladeshensis TaxID=310355 RepID=A0A8J3JLR7_9ACTN|nr:succinate dehydrogenase [Catellatospora sp. IY07-71]GIF80254.1 succinate dehydrogenase [Catellatospora bangladeshensis]
MAISGAALVLFLLAHMIGNLKIFFGADAFDHYAHWLRDIGAPMLPHSGFLWIQRVGLLVALVLHIWSAAVLTIRARKARPVKYAHRKPVQGSYAARTMRWGGVIVFLFVVYHILDLTTRHLNPVADTSKAHAAVAADFGPDRWYVTAFYTLAVVTLGFHLRHGIWSALQTLGVSNARRERVLKAVAFAVAFVICAGFLAVPFAVLTGLVK